MLFGYCCFCYVEESGLLNSLSLDQIVPNLMSPVQSSGIHLGLQMDHYSRKVFVGGLPPDIAEGLMSFTTELFIMLCEKLFNYLDSSKFYSTWDTLISNYWLLNWLVVGTLAPSHCVSAYASFSHAFCGQNSREFALTVIIRLSLMIMYKNLGNHHCLADVM